MSDTAGEMLYLYLLGLAIILILVVGTWKAWTAGEAKQVKSNGRDSGEDDELAPSPTDQPGRGSRGEDPGASKRPTRVPR